MADLLLCDLVLLRFLRLHHRIARVFQRLFVHGVARRARLTLMISGDGCAVPGARVCIGAQGSVPWRCFAQCYDLPTHRRPHTYSAHISRHDEGCFQPVWLLQAPSCDFCPSSRWPAIVLVAMSGKLALRLALRCFRRVVTLWRIAVYMFMLIYRTVPKSRSSCALPPFSKAQPSHLVRGPRDHTGLAHVLPLSSAAYRSLMALEHESGCSFFLSQIFKCVI